MTQLFMVHPTPGHAPAPPTLPPEWSLRPATDADVSGLAELLTEAFEETWTVERVRGALTDAPDVVRTWVVADEQGLVGTASERLHELHPDAGYVHWVGVRERARGHALGYSLTYACLRGFVERGFARAVLETDDFRVPAIRTYLRLGFIPEYRNELERRTWSQVVRGLSSGRPA